MLLYECVEKAKKVLLSLEYPCKDLVTPIQKELKPVLNHDAESFAISFSFYLSKSLDTNGAIGEFNESDLEKLSEIKAEDYMTHLRNLVNISSKPSDLLHKLLQRLS